MLGVIAAVRGGAVDRFITVLTGVCSRFPPSGSAVLLVYVFAVQLRLLPATGFVPFAVEPRGVVQVARAARAHDRDHVDGRHRAADPRVDVGGAHAGAHAHTARRRHADARASSTSTRCAGASLPILASVAIQFIVLFGGSVVIELLFALPGIGQAMQSAVGSADLPFVQALVLVATLVVVVVNVVLELLNRTLDPKLRTS